MQGRLERLPGGSELCTETTMLAHRALLPGDAGRTLLEQRPMMWESLLVRMPTAECDGAHLSPVPGGRSPSVRRQLVQPSETLTEKPSNKAKEMSGKAKT